MRKRVWAQRLVAAALLALVGGCRGTSDAAETPGAVEQVAIITIADVSGRKVIWHDEAVKYRDARLLDVRLTPQQARQLEDLCATARKHFPSGEWNNFGPDSGYREIVISCPAGAFELRSWHPVIERNPFLVAASYGVSTLGGKTREQLLSEDDPDYIARRNAFDALERELIARFGQ